MSEQEHIFTIDSVCDVCGYSAEYLLSKALQRIALLEAAARWIAFADQRPPPNATIWIHDDLIVWSDFWHESRMAVPPDWKAWRLREVKPLLPQPPSKETTQEPAP